MSIIWITTISITVIGLIVGAGLVFTGKKFYVETNEREAAVREALPGNNCGACGYAGCDAMAAAVDRGEAPVNGCPVGGAAVTEKIGAIMGVQASPPERIVAFVKCKGSHDVTKNQGSYVGPADCRSAALSGLAISSCDYGCFGLGSCAAVCETHAIRIVNGVAVVNRARCVACGLCVKVCPRNLIELVPEHCTVGVQCSNREKGPLVKKVCSAGCIGCTLCARECEEHAITVMDNIAKVNYDTCTQCGKCAEKCPAKVITPPAGRRKAEANDGKA